MGVYVLCGLLFVYAATAVPVPENEAAELEITDEFLQNWDFIFSGDMYVLDDNEKPVKIDLSSNHPESIESTQKDLENRVHFYLYTRKSPKSPESLFLDDVNTLRKSKFDARKETKFVTHGWMNSHKSKACTLVRDAFLKQGDYNVIVVGWSGISARPYIWSSNRVLMVAQYVSRMIDFLVSQGLNPSRVTTVGHSLGAHIAGLSAHYAKQKIRYVVGLDPALPNFIMAGPGNRLARGDADYVQVIHTNAGLLGYSASIGDADFFPNGGESQKGCVVDLGGSCSHSRSYEYFAESINSKLGFFAKKCGNFADFKNGRCNSNAGTLMGGVKPQFNVKGNYYLYTHSSSPFALGR